ncbi:hypothetical protein KJ870_10360 [bacterium]|nr:hypothetical protein [bacterium]MBU1435329.1 hypothetical protein [bacterium]MBU1503527.1 hypothetical protein [bacterium]
MSQEYKSKARLIDNISNIEQYRPILEKDNFQEDEPHWRRISKNAITLFQVLIDQDLTDLVNILKHYPKYTEWVCEHFRYAYSYSENYADINAASELLFMGEPYFSKQFVRNVVRKLPKIDSMNYDELTKLNTLIAKEHSNWHPIISNYFLKAVSKNIEKLNLHPLQKIALKKPILHIEYKDTYKYDAQDRDAFLDIPYMN